MIYNLKKSLIAFASLIVLFARNQKFSFHAVATLLLCLSTAAQASAAPITGTLNVTGAVRLTPTSLSFVPIAPSGATANLGPGSTGLFSSLYLGSEGIVVDTAYAAGTSQPGFLSLGFAFDLTSLEAGTFKSTKCDASKPAAGQTCTPAGTALSLVNTTDHSCSVSITMRGNFRDPAGEETPYVGVMTFQFADRNFQQLLADITAGGTPPTTFSASFAPAELPQ